jgi:WD40 repeat protein
VTEGGATHGPDQFDDELIAQLLAVEDYVARPWLERRVLDACDQPGCRIVLVTGEPGAGKSVLLASLARADPRSLRYFLRRDSVRTHRAGDVHSFLESVGQQLATRYPELYLDSDLVVEVTQSAGAVATGGLVVGIRADEVVASPFRRTAVRVSQELGQVAGAAVGMEIGRLTVDLRAMDWRNVQHLALLGPVRGMARVEHAGERVLLLIDALDESTAGVAEWLAALPALPDALRIVVSARRGEYLEPIRLSQPTQLRELRLDTDEEHARADVASYLTASAARPDLAATLGGRAAVLLRRWREVAGGNFQYAGTLIAAVRAAVRRGDAEAVDDLLSPHAVPPDLRSLYALLTTRLRLQVRPRTVRLRDASSGSAWDDVYAPVLGGLAVARQPMSARDLATLAADRARPAQVRDALVDMLQFLDERDGTYRLHHRSFADFLTDPDTERAAQGCYLDSEEWHRALGLLGGREVLDAPASASAYSRAHAVHHLLQAEADNAVRAVLADLTTSFPAVQERIAASGVDAVADEEVAAADRLGPEAGLVRAVGRVLDRQRHTLRTWPAGTDRAFLAQQLHNEARVAGFPEVADFVAEHLDRSAVLAVAFSVGSDLRPQLRTIDAGLIVHALIRIDDDRFAAGCENGTVRVYAVATGRLLQTWKAADRAVLAIGWSPRHGIVWGSLDGYVGRWHPDSEQASRLRTVGVRGASDSPITYDMQIAITALNRQDGSWDAGGPGSVHAIAIRATDGEVAVGTRQGAVLVVHPDFDQFAAGVPLHSKVVTGLHFSPKRIVACSHDGRVRATDLTSATVLATAPCAYTGLTVLPDGRVVASRWDGATDVALPGEEGSFSTMRTSGGNGAATAVASGPTGRVHIGFANRRIWTHDEAFRFRASLRGHGDDVISLAEATDDVLLSSARDRTVRLWDLHEPGTTYRTAGHDGPVSTLLSTDAGLLSGSADGTLRLWGPGGTALGEIDLGYGQIWSLCELTPGQIAAATQSGKVLLLALSGRVELVLSAHTAEARAVVALDADRLVSGDISGNLVLWQRQRGEWKGTVLKTRPLFGVVQMARIAPFLIGVCDGEKRVRLVDVAADSAQVLDGHDAPVHTVGPGPDATLLSGSHDGTARRWDPDTREVLQVFGDHQADVSAVVTVSDRLLLTGAGDGTVQVWRVPDQRPVGRAVLDQPVDCIDFDRRTCRLAVGHANGSITVLDARHLLAAHESS